MEVRVSGYYQDDSKGAQRELQVALNEGDGARIFSQPKWDGWTPATQIVKLTAMADIFLHQYAASRGFRAEHAVAEDIQKIVERDLK